MVKTKRNQEPAHWRKPYVKWTAAEWAAEDMTRSDFVEVEREALSYWVWEEMLHGPPERDIKGHRSLAKDAFGGLVPEFLEAYDAWLDDEDDVWRYVTTEEILRLLEDQIRNASDKQILGYAWDVSKA